MAIYMSKDAIRKACHCGESRNPVWDAGLSPA